MGDSHYIFIKGIKGAEILDFSKYEQSSSSHSYLTSTVKINSQIKQVTSVFEFKTKKIDHEITNLAGIE